jgi:hypothetical protein
MAYTLFIVEDKFFTDLPQSVRDDLLDETKRLFKFIPKFHVVTRQPAQFPAALDFTDSVFRLGEDDDAVTAFSNDSPHQQWKNIRDSITQRGIRVQLNISHATAKPEVIGVAIMWKDVITAGGDRLAITMTGGTASLKAVELEVVQALAHGREKHEILEYQKKRQRKDPDVYHGSKKEAEDTADLRLYDLLDKPLKDWPPVCQKYASLALARALAHEVRHQYVGPHATAGLGSDAPAIWGDKNYEDFSDADKGDIHNAITQLERKQTAATIQIETFAKGQTFPF